MQAEDAIRAVVVFLLYGACALLFVVLLGVVVQ